MLQEMPVMSSGGGGVDISDIIDVQTMMIAQSSRNNAIYTVGIKKILVDASASGYSVSLYSDSSATQTIQTNITTATLVDVSNYNVIYTTGSGSVVLTYITVKE